MRVLRQVAARRGFAVNLLDEALAGRPLDAREAALARELAFGVLRHRITLDRLIDQHLRCRPANLDATLRDLLRVGLYQCLWLERVPDRAAVGEAVEQAKRLVSTRGAGLVNGVLRAILSHVLRIGPRREAAEPTHLLPLDAERFCELDYACLPDPSADPVAYWSAATSHPCELVRRWRADHGLIGMERICRYGAGRPHVWLRPNALKTSAGELARRLRDEGATVEPLDERAVLYIEGPPPVATGAYAEGLFQPQDLSGIEVVEALAPKPGEVIVDLCAAPGTKASAIAEQTGNAAIVLASDRDMKRLRAAGPNFDRLGITSVELIAAGELAACWPRHGPPDAILLDAPCSNTGVLARRPEARYRWNRRTLASLVETQNKLLHTAAGLSSVGTRIVYSTCSIEPEENEQVIQRFCQALPHWRLVESALRLPNPGGQARPPRDGGYWALLRQKG